MFRNPLVSPDILGVTAASGFGAAVALLLSKNAFELQLISF
jgi:iron complex transport system permease protein